MRKCSVDGCNAKYNGDVTLHKLPTNPHKKEEWVNAAKITKKITSNIRVCSLHFKNDDYTGKFPRKFLKKDVIPSQNLPSKKVSKNKNSSNKSDTSSAHIVINPPPRITLNGRLETDEETDSRINDSTKYSRLTRLRTPVISKKSNHQQTKSVCKNASVKKNILREQPEPIQTKNKRRGRPPKRGRKRHILLDEKLTEKKAEHRANEAKVAVEKNMIPMPAPIKEEIRVKDERETDTNFQTPRSVTPDAINNIKEEPVEIIDVDPIEKSYPLLYGNEIVHVPDFIDCEQRPQQKKCAVCFKKVLNKEVCTYCPECPGTPPLCLQSCFRTYHGY